MKTKNLIITVMLFLMLAPQALAIDVGLVSLENSISAKLEANQVKTTASITSQADRCRVEMAEWTTIYLDERQDSLKKTLWFDRIITFFLIFFAVFLAGSFRGWREHARRVKERQIEMANNQAVKKQIIASFEKASTTAKWNGTEVVAVRKEFMDKLKKEVK